MVDGIADEIVEMMAKSVHEAGMYSCLYILAESRRWDVALCRTCSLTISIIYPFEAHRRARGTVRVLISCCAKRSLPRRSPIRRSVPLYASRQMCG